MRTLSRVLMNIYNSYKLGKIGRLQIIQGLKKPSKIVPCLEASPLKTI